MSGVCSALESKGFICLTILHKEILSTPWNLVGLYEAECQDLSEEGHQNSKGNLKELLLNRNDHGAIHTCPLDGMYADGTCCGQ